MNGKGSAPREGADRKAYATNWEKIFGDRGDPAMTSRCHGCEEDKTSNRDPVCGGYGHMEVPDDVNEPLCNLCGLTCTIGHPESPARGPHGLIKAQVIGGYESTPGNGCGALDDMTRYTFSLCEFCLDWLFEHFQVPVKTDDPMRDYRLREGETVEEGVERMGVVSLSTNETPMPPFRPASQRCDEDVWRKGREEFYAERDRRTAAREGRR